MAAKPRNQFGRRTFSNYLSMIHNGKPVTQPFRLVHVMRGQEHRAARLLERANDVPELAAALRIKSGSGPVEKNYFGGTDTPVRYPHPLALPSTTFPHPSSRFF